MVAFLILQGSSSDCDREQRGIPMHLILCASLVHVECVCQLILTQDMLQQVMTTKNLLFSATSATSMLSNHVGPLDHPFPNPRPCPPIRHGRVPRAGRLAGPRRSFRVAGKPWQPGVADPGAETGARSDAKCGGPVPSNGNLRLTNKTG